MEEVQQAFEKWYLAQYDSPWLLERNSLRYIKRTYVNHRTEAVFRGFKAAAFLFSESRTNENKQTGD